MPEIIDVNINLINKKGLEGALFACPISLLIGTLIFKGSIIKNKIHQINMNIKTCVKIAIKI